MPEQQSALSCCLVGCGGCLLVALALILAFTGACILIWALLAAASRLLFG